MYWLSARTRNDLFLLYCFTDTDCPTAQLRDVVAERSARIPDLRVRARAVPGNLDYPSWVRCEFRSDQFIEHVLPEPDWAHLQAALGEVVDTGVDAAVRPWRLHVFRGVVDAPAQPDASPALVAVLQMSHALADGRRAAEIARALFETEPAVDGAANSSARGAPATSRFATAKRVGISSTSALRRSVPASLALSLPRMPIQVARTAFRGYKAFRAQQELAELTAKGELPPPGPGFPPSLINHECAEPNSAHLIRMLVCHADALRLPGRTVTVVVLTAVSIALPRYLEQRGEPVERLGAQVPMALSATAMPNARNNYRSLSIDLFIDEPDLCTRADKITADMTARRTRALHPLLAAQDRVTSVVPAPLLRRDIDRYPLDTVPGSIAGHTVVSSVHRGPANLSFGGGLVRYTAGFPAIGSVMRLTHGVHGLGDTVTISLHADSATVPDIDAYAALLRAALDEVRGLK
ncbi:wax ester synthase-like acyl-CoA acyltransferase family protein [Nocardia tenerifensis]|uniref:Wax ester synthase-like acyl-CoA acyltransferase family protein n=2 Tax=Nocardia tenerifensis TaxID=228006 RepID=A0A318JYX3_9NOCA|nr:wax ester synthase-like acyl-CoA acyltransferase family protein [Nocardia tenerifensis]